MKGKYLITTDAWFFAPDGNMYRAAWGEVEIFTDEILGIKTNRNATNWFAKVGSEDNHIIIAGCQIHYSIRSEQRPNSGKVLETCADPANGLKEYHVQTRIYFAE